MIVVTGGLGFIGSNLVKKLLVRKLQHTEIVVLDTQIMPLNEIRRWIMTNKEKIITIFHLGAITDTTETNEKKLYEYNTSFSMFVWNICSLNDILLIYASSAATYGNGSLGFDDEKNIDDLEPLNLYGWSKQKFDIHTKYNILEPKRWYGLKFFNVYGFGEHHKDKMASVIFQAYKQIKETGQIKLFKSHRDDYNHGEQKRDFIYIDDIIDIMFNFFYSPSHPQIERPKSGIYNIGTGKARSYNDMAKAVFKSLGVKENISYIDIPENIRNQYQYFTEAKTNKLMKSNCGVEFHELENGISKYINQLLKYENC